MSERFTRLNVNLSAEISGDLHSYASRKGVSVTEAIRRAIPILKEISEAQDRGAAIIIEEEGGKQKEVRFFI